MNTLREGLLSVMRKHAIGGRSIERADTLPAPFNGALAVPPEASDYFGAVLAAKLNPPLASPVLLERTPLCDRICSAQDARLILLNAPAGFGKTTLMLQSYVQLKTRGVAASWLTLDSADNDATRFLVFFAGAFQRLLISSDSPNKQLGVFSTSPSAGGLAVELISRIRSIEQPFALYVDDVEHIQNPIVFDILREFLRHIPAHGRIVLGSRQTPELGLGRLRAQGHLLELGAEELRFTLDDTRELLSRSSGPSLDDVSLERLHGRTEGWAAALWLAHLALQKSPDPRGFIEEFSGSSSAIATYLAEDVLGHLDATTRKFLLRTSVLSTLNAEVCDALLDRTDSHERLAELERAHLFLIPIDSESRNYRYHSLFAQFLKTQLSLQMRGEIPRLHRRAAEWYETARRPVPAIEHALESSDQDYALRLLEKHGERLLVEGRLRLLARWLDQLSHDALLSHPVLQAIHLWAVMYTRGPKQVMPVYEALQARGNLDPELSAHLLALGPSLLVVMDRLEEAYALGRKNREVLSSEHSFAYAMLANAMAHAAFVNGNYEQALEWVEDARRIQSVRGDTLNLIFSETVEGEIDLLQARLRQATSRFRLAAEMRAPDVRTPSRNRNVLVGVPLAEVLYETGASDEALRLLQAYLPLVKDLGLPDQLISGHIILSRLLHTQGDPIRGLQLLLELEHSGHATGLPRALASAKMERARLAILRGDYNAADAELQRASAMGYSHHMNRFSTPANDVDTLTIGRIRWMIHTGSAQAAIPLLRQEISAAERSQRLRRSLKLRILLALALHEHKDQRVALTTMREILGTMSGEGFVRIFADEGARAAQLLIEYLGQHTSAQNPKVTVEYLVQLKSACGIEASTQGSTDNVLSDAPVEALTPTEIKVLNLLAEGFTNQVMAERMFVSETTVRTHLRNINAKLSAQSRTQAVAIGRRMGIVQ